MTKLASRRLAAQQLAKGSFDDPCELVSWLGAVQAQDYDGAQWALGVRLSGAGQTAIERALSEGRLLRTHAMRWTWQLVAPADIRWILPLVATRLIPSHEARHRELGLDAGAQRRCFAVLEKSLADGAELTRSEISSALAAHRIDASGPRLSHLLGLAELRALITSGPRRGKQRTHVLLDRRVPAKKPLARDAALAELARRYFQSRGPATLADFRWWSGLEVADARAAVESIAAELDSEIVAGQTYWALGAARAARARRALLLPAFDEFLVGYANRAAMLEPRHVSRVNGGGGLLNPCVVIGDRVVGTWRRTLARDHVAIEIRGFDALSPDHLEAIGKAARRYGEFLGLDARVTRRR